MTPFERPCLTERLRQPLAAATLVALVCMISLGFALIMQHVFNHPPCELCLWQRAPYVVAATAAATSAILSILSKSPKATRTSQERNRRLALLLLNLCVLIFLTGAALGLYHSGVERHWWQSATSCSLPPLNASSAGLRDQLLSMPVARCDEIGWSLLGMTMANINVPFSLALAAFCFLAARTNRDRRNAK